MTDKQKFISHGSGGWEVYDQGTDRFSVWWGPVTWFVDSTFSLCHHMGGGVNNLP